MNNEEFLAELYDLNYEYVCETPTGFGLYRKKNKTGGYTYMTDELNAVIWDTCLVPECDLLCSIVEEHHRRIAEIHRRKNDLG